MYTRAGSKALGSANTLGELAIWLGVNEVEIFDLHTRQPLEEYINLVAPAVQMNVPVAAAPVVMPPSAVPYIAGSSTATPRQVGWCHDGTVSRNVIDVAVPHVLMLNVLFQICAGAHHKALTSAHVYCVSIFKL